jgi:hypothetical protein
LFSIHGSCSLAWVVIEPCPSRASLSGKHILNSVADGVIGENRQFDRLFRHARVAPRRFAGQPLGAAVVVRVVSRRLAALLAPVAASGAAALVIRSTARRFFEIVGVATLGVTVTAQAVSGTGAAFRLAIGAAAAVRAEFVRVAALGVHRIAAAFGVFARVAILLTSSWASIRKVFLPLLLPIVLVLMGLLSVPGLCITQSQEWLEESPDA